MAWGNTNLSTQAPEWATRLGTGGDPTYANTVAQNHGVNVFGVPAAQVAAKHVTHPGWVHSVKGSGPVASFTVSVPGTGYSNTNVAVVSGGTANAIGTIVTNGSGVIQSVAVSTPGAGFVTLAGSTIAVQNSTFGTTGVGTGATLTFTLGGRAGRISNETLVAMKSMAANGAGSEFNAL